MHIASTGSSFNFSSQFLSSYGSDFIRFILNWISPIQKCVSLGPEEAILKAKVLFTNCLLLDETGLRAKHHLQKGVLGIWKSSRNCNKLDPAKYLHPESHEFEFPAPGDYDELDRRTVRWRGTLRGTWKNQWYWSHLALQSAPRCRNFFTFSLPSTSYSSNVAPYRHPSTQTNRSI